jgi:hypothetical protein
MVAMATKVAVAAVRAIGDITELGKDAAQPLDRSPLFDSLMTIKI